MNGFEKRTEEKKKQILDTAFRLMNQQDGHKTMTVDELAKQANVAKTTIFKYFGNKEALVQEVYKRFITEMSTSVEVILSKNESFEKTLLEISFNKLRFLKDLDESFYLEMMQQITTKQDDGLSVLMEKFASDSHAMMLDLFHRGRKEKKIDLKYSDEFLLLYFQTLAEGLSHPQIYEQLLPYTSNFSEVIIKGISPR
ncbi:TetR/AcrR family transcriptional regulator [Exiguobacterium sp. TBG-PICH-001]|uniref:TetR/AcrR family transcriptional regulator n=1 Tax=Exiguobacterium abrahamii TaxID=2785532 RepID=UPI0018A72543|nr:TetR/AcrR family transcriptional regulator [Exiguobacterium sp. TBG-PICH-001]MBF8153118.1 TetR/AcrR family transcriptional regulator [Exiguobacterium sp. TBG-PICH-001]